MNKILFFIFMCLFITVSHAASPLSLDNLEEGVLSLTSDHFEFDNLNGTITYSGHVEAALGDRKLVSDELIIYRNPDGDITKIIAKGKPAHVQGSVDDQPEIIDAYADLIEYDMQKEIIYLRQNARVKRGKDLYEAPEIQYDVANEVISSAPNNKGRTHIMIDAETLKNDAPKSDQNYE